MRPVCVCVSAPASPCQSSCTWCAPCKWWWLSWWVINSWHWGNMYCIHTGTLLTVSILQLCVCTYCLCNCTANVKCSRKPNMESPCPVRLVHVIRRGNAILEQLFWASLWDNLILKTLTYWTSQIDAECLRLIDWSTDYFILVSCTFFVPSPHFL